MPPSLPQPPWQLRRKSRPLPRAPRAPRTLPLPQSGDPERLSCERRALPTGCRRGRTESPGPSTSGAPCWLTKKKSLAGRLTPFLLSNPARQKRRFAGKCQQAFQGAASHGVGGAGHTVGVSHVLGVLLLLPPTTRGKRCEKPRVLPTDGDSPLKHAAPVCALTRDREGPLRRQSPPPLNATHREAAPGPVHTASTDVDHTRRQRSAVSARVSGLKISKF